MNNVVWLRKEGLALGRILEHCITYDFGSGDTFTTGENHFALSPTETPGVFNLSDQGRVTEGTGRFLESFGKLVLHGTVSFSASGTGEAVLKVKGKLCDIAQ